MMASASSLKRKAGHQVGVPPLLQDASGVENDVAAAAQHWQARLERASERVASLQRKAAARLPSTVSLRAGF
jgi:predicted transcriptional regulator